MFNFYFLIIIIEKKYCNRMFFNGFTRFSNLLLLRAFLHKMPVYPCVNFVLWKKCVKLGTNWAKFQIYVFCYSEQILLKICKKLPNNNFYVIFFIFCSSFVHRRTVGDLSILAGKYYFWRQDSCIATKLKNVTDIHDGMFGIV